MRNRLLSAWVDQLLVVEAAELIKDDELWLAILNDRNSTAHSYNEQLAIEICRNIREKYVIALMNLLENIEKRLGE